jgi:hypothetical protein
MYFECQTALQFVPAVDFTTLAIWGVLIASVGTLDGSHTAVCTIWPSDGPPAASPIAT